MKKILIALVCLLIENLTAMEADQLTEFEKKYNAPTSLVKAELIEKHRVALERSKVYILISEYKQTAFAKNLKQVLEWSIKGLNKSNVASKVLITIDGEKEDKGTLDNIFKDFKYSTSITIECNDSNIKTSATRWKQLDWAYKEMQEDMKNGLLPYFFILDADDIIHQEFILLALLTQLETGAKSVRPQNIQRCYKEDNTSILETIKSYDIAKFWYYACGNCDATMQLFSGDVLDLIQKKKEEQMKEPSLNTLFQLSELADDKRLTICLSQEKLENRNSIFEAPFHSKTSSEVCLFYYMQHSGSLEHNFLNRCIEYCKNIPSSYKIKWNLEEWPKEDQQNLLFVFGCAEWIPEPFKVKGLYNKGITKKDLLDAWKYMHKAAKTMKEAIENLEEEKWMEFPVYKWLVNGGKELPDQDTSGELSPEFLEWFYAPVLRVIFQEQESNIQQDYISQKLSSYLCSGV